MCPSFLKGDYNQSCAICGFDYKHSQLRKNWKGLWVCDVDYDKKPLQFEPTIFPRNEGAAKSVVYNQDSTPSTVVLASAYIIPASGKWDDLGAIWENYTGTWDSYS